MVEGGGAKPISGGADGVLLRVALTRRFTRLKRARTQWVVAGQQAGNRRRSCGLFAPGFVLIQHHTDEGGAAACLTTTDTALSQGKRLLGKLKT